MRNYLIAGFLFLIMAIAGCSSSPSGSGTGTNEEKLVEITQEEWDAQSEAVSYCRALDDLNALEEGYSKCVTDQLGSDLADKIKEWEKQSPLRSEIQGQKDAEQQKEIEKNYNLSIGTTAVIPSFNREITLVSIDIPQDKSGVLAKIKIKNLNKYSLTITFDDEFYAVDSDGNYYRASNPVKTTSVWSKMVATVQPDEEVTKDILFKLDPEKVRIEHIEYKESGKVLATWI
ncbi:hypothetical protein HYV85_02765 [Candidatus Woesearchaeota archaeon]|nr:hypothetical protein [Candidatus Woesearchaeota archaeon]